MAGSISTLGVGSGLQLQDILDKLKAVDQKVIDRKKDSITKVQAQLDEFTTVNNKLLTLKSSALKLSLAGTFIGRTISSSAASTVTATVTDGATVKGSALTVDNLAQKSSFISTGVLDPAVTSIASTASTLSLTIGTETSSLSVAAGTTMNQLMAQINSATDNPGLTASVINDGGATTPYKLILTANSYGEQNRISILLPLPDLPLTVQASQAAANSLNAQFSMDGIAYQRQSNTVSDVLTGVSFTLQGEGAATLTVANNNAALQETISTLVTGYNDAVQEIKAKSSYDSTAGEFGVLNATTLRDLPSELQGLMSTFNSADPDGNIRSLFDLGMEFNRDGSITIDDTILTAAINDHSAGVQAFFLGDTTNEIEGFADKLNNRLRTLSGAAGTIAGEKSAAQTRIADLNLKVEVDTARLNKRYEQLTKQFVALDTYMNQMTSMSNFLTGQFKSLSDTTSTN